MARPAAARAAHSHVTPGRKCLVDYLVDYLVRKLRKTGALRLIM
jgi:hypothetical protein